MGGGTSFASGHSVQASLLKLTPTITIRSCSNSTSLDNPEECLEEFFIDSTVVKRFFPYFENYVSEKCSLSELEQANKSRLFINTPPHYVEFDHIFYQTLNVACLDMPFMTKTLSYKKQFVLELMRLLTCSKAGFGEKVLEFVQRRKSESISLEDYGLLGQVFLESISALRSEEDLRLWTKAYCRFLRALLSQGSKLDFPMEEETALTLG